MSDTLSPAVAEHKKVFFAVAKPSKETPLPNTNVIPSIDAIIKNIDAHSTVSDSVIRQFTTQIEKNRKHFNDAKASEIDKNLLSLKKEMDALEVIETADALATIDSPWGELAQKLADSDKLKRSLPDKKSREQYMDKLLFPLGARIFRDIRSMTSDPLTRQLMFQSIADEVLQNPTRIQSAQEALPLPQNTNAIKDSMRHASVLLLGGKSNTEYTKLIHTTVLRSRLSAEQPLFDISATQHSIREMEHEHAQTVVPFAKEELAQSLREAKTLLSEMKSIRNIVDHELPSVHNETSLMRALDKVQSARFKDTEEEVAPYKFEHWVPEHVRSGARNQLEQLSKPKEDLYAKMLKQLGEAEKHIRSGNNTWAAAKYKDHMKWLADPVLQTQRKQRIINTIDLVMTITTLVSGVSGNTQRLIEGPPSGINLNDLIQQAESQKPWEVAADLATPKSPKNKMAARPNIAVN